MAEELTAISTQRQHMNAMAALDIAHYTLTGYALGSAGQIDG